MNWGKVSVRLGLEATAVWKSVMFFVSAGACWCVKSDLDGRWKEEWEEWNV